MLREKSTAIATSLVFVVLGLSSCGRKHRQSAAVPRVPQTPNATAAPRRRSSQPAAVPVGYIEEGLASWYGHPYHGRAAADGEIYDMETLVAAHRVMPFNTWLRVTNLANNKSVDVRVIDRGPFVGGRIIDLSHAAARDIDLLGPGVARVRLQVIASPADVPANDFYGVQVGAFTVYANAEKLRAEYAQRFGNSQLALKQGAVPLWRVLVGKESSLESAQQLATVLASETRNVFVVRLDEAVLRGNKNTAPPPPASPTPAESPLPESSGSPSAPNSR